MRPDGYLWSCDLKNYPVGRTLWVEPGRIANASFRVAQGAWYAWHFYTCATDRPSDAIAHAVESWNLGHKTDMRSVAFEVKYGTKGQKIARRASRGTNRRQLRR